MASKSTVVLCYNIILVMGLMCVLLPSQTASQDITSMTVIPGMNTIGVQWAVDDPDNKINSFLVKWSDGKETVTNETHQYTIEDLYPCNEQKIVVTPQGNDSNKIGEEGKATISTLTEIPPEVTKLESVNITSQAALLSWNRPETDCSITDYTLLINGHSLWNSNLTEHRYESIHVDTGSDNSTVEYLLEELTPYGAYVISITAATVSGNSSASFLKIETLEDVPSAPRNVTSQTTGEATIAVSWQAPLELNGHLTNYNVQWTRDGAEVGADTVTADKLLYIIEDTQVNDADMVTVWANTAAGRSEGENSPINPITCSLPFAMLRGRCIMVHTVSSGTWPEMMELCEAVGGHLVKISSADFMADLVFFINNNGLNLHNYWVGASDDNVLGEWKWLDGSPVKLGTPFWGDNDEQIQGPFNSSDINYAFLNSDEDYFMWDTGADPEEDIASAICEQGIQ